MTAYIVSQTVVDDIVDDMTDMVQDLLLRDVSPLWLHGSDDERIALERGTMIALGDRVAATIESRYMVAS